MKNRLQRAWDLVQNKWYTPYYLWLYGSQNYWIDIETSDFDFKCIIIPNLKDLIRNTKPVSEVIEFEWWQIDIKDIRSYIDSAVKVNVNFIEILQTEHHLWDTKLRKFYKPLLEEMWWQYLRACFGMMKMKKEALRHPYPSKISEIEKYWYDPKQLCHIARLNILMNRYIDWNYYLKHSDEEKIWLLNIKSWMFSQDQIDFVADNYLADSQNIIDNYNKQDIFDTKKELIEFSYNIIEKYIWKYGL